MEENYLYLKENLLKLNTNKLKHSLNCYKLAANLINKNENLQPIRNNILILALFHDIGYSKDLNIFNFHSIDGALYLDGKISNSIVKAIAQHSGAILLLENRKNANDIIKVMNIYNIETKEEKLLLKIINYIDTRVDSRGHLVTLEERYLDIAERYGKKSIQAKVNKYIQTKLLHDLSLNTNADKLKKYTIEEAIEKYYFTETDYIERPCSIAESIRESFEEIKLFKQNKKKFIPIDKLLDESQKEVKEVERKDKKIETLLNQLEKEIEKRIY